MVQGEVRLTDDETCVLYSLWWSWFLGQVKVQAKVESIGCQLVRPCLNNRRR